jgi:hypothetical protein
MALTAAQKAAAQEKAATALDVANSKVTAAANKVAEKQGPLQAAATIANAEAANALRSATFTNKYTPSADNKAAVTAATKAAGLATKAIAPALKLDLSNATTSRNAAYTESLKEIADYKPGPQISTIIGAIGGSKVPADPNASYYNTISNGKFSYTAPDSVFSPLTGLPKLSTAKTIQSKEDVANAWEALTGKPPTDAQLVKYGNSNTSDAALSAAIKASPQFVTKSVMTPLMVTQEFYRDLGRAPTNAELLTYTGGPKHTTKYSIGDISKYATSGAQLPTYLANLNTIGQTAFTAAKDAAKEATQVALAKSTTPTDAASVYQDVYKRPPTSAELAAFAANPVSPATLNKTLTASPEYLTNLTKPFIPNPVYDAAGKATIEGAGPVQNAPSFGLGNLQSQLSAQLSAPSQGFNFAAPNAPTITPPPITPPPAGVAAIPPPMSAPSPEIDAMLRQREQDMGIGALTAQAGQNVEVDPGNVSSGDIGSAGPMQFANGGLSSLRYNLGGYSDGGRLLKGPGDGVSDSIPAQIGNRQPARLADGEFVIPARIVSELGNGSTDAGARRLYAMMDRIQKARRKTVGKGKVAVNNRADKYLPA